MEPIKILLGKNKHKRGVNEDNFIGVELGSSSKVLPHTEDTYHIDSYLQYFREKDESEKYRLAFTITPFCSNILFNVITEPVYKEGSDECVVITPTALRGNANPFDSYNARALDRYEAIRDTGYSHPKVGPLVYHCGYDIFNNHFLRKKGFTIVNSGTTDNVFNTLNDRLRRNEGSPVKDVLLEISSSNGKLNTGETPMHLYQYDTVYSYAEAVYENLVENNGWFGFLNATTLPINNITVDGVDYSLNKCMNNNKAWEQIDMYPDRSLYSFVPKINKYRGRVERNWDYCITYPATSTTDNDLVQNAETGINGLKCKIVTELTNASIENEDMLVTFKSFIRHNLVPGEYITLSFVQNGSNERKTANPVKIESIGDGHGDDDHYFAVRLSAFFNEIAKITTTNGNSNVNGIVMPYDFTEIRFRKYEGGSEAVYYIRQFVKVKSQFVDGEGKNTDLAGSLNKLAFSQNIYSDQVAQIVFTDDVDTTGMLDNLGRPVSELFLTIVKRNKGYDKWYGGRNFRDPEVEYSHCFGEITSGFDMPADDECKDYNVHRIHSVGFNAGTNGASVSGVKITPSPKKLESGLNIDDFGTEENPFMGDIVEFSVSRLQETSLSPVYHRFNTAQRETKDDTMYGVFKYDEIIHDDYDIGEHGGTNGERFETSAMTFGRGTMINIIPEGYYYRPHYSVRIRSFEDEVQQGSHIKVSVSERSGNGSVWTITAATNYYFEAKSDEEFRKRDGSEVYAYKIYGGKILDTASGTCVGVEGEMYNVVTIEFTKNVDLDSGKWVIFKKNPAEPPYSYELDDGTGRYLWRNVLSYSDMTPDDSLYDEVFTNGAHYFHDNISFYLKRQDPYGEYGIGNEPEDVQSDFIISPKHKDVSVAEFATENEGGVC